MASPETARVFGVELAKALGLSVERLMSFSVEVGPASECPLAVVTAKYAAPRGAGEAAATLVRKFGLVPGEVGEAEGADLERSTSLIADVETVHRCATAVAEICARYEGAGDLAGFLREAAAAGVTLEQLHEHVASAAPVRRSAPSDGAKSAAILAELRAIRELLEGWNASGAAMTTVVVR